MNTGRKERDMTTRYELWQHRTAGETWMVELDDQRVVRSAGPIYYEDVQDFWMGKRMTDPLWNTEDNEWMESEPFKVTAPYTSA